MSYIRFYAGDGNLYVDKVMEEFIDKATFRSWALSQLQAAFPSHDVTILEKTTTRWIEHDDPDNALKIRLAGEVLWEEWYVPQWHAKFPPEGAVK